jgi:hypothetical protein
MRFPLAVAVTFLTLTLPITAIAEPAVDVHAAAKRCFKKKHGKRVRVKCPKKKATTKKPPAVPAPAPTTPRMDDPATIAALTSRIDGHLLHHFSTNGAPGSFAGDERLVLCSGGRYQYYAALDPALPGLTGAGKAIENGSWRVTGALASADKSRIDGGVILLPADGSSPHLARLALVASADSSTIAFVNGDQWYLSQAAPCAAAT